MDAADLVPTVATHTHKSREIAPHRAVPQCKYSRDGGTCKRGNDCPYYHGSVGPTPRKLAVTREAISLENAKRSPRLRWLVDHFKGMECEETQLKLTLKIEPPAGYPWWPVSEDNPAALHIDIVGKWYNSRNMDYMLIQWQVVPHHIPNALKPLAARFVNAYFCNKLKRHDDMILVSTIINEFTHMYLWHTMLACKRQPHIPHTKEEKRDLARRMIRVIE